MSIYTKTGDKGTTSIYGGKRISKDDLIIEATGSIDELSTFIGLIVNYITDKKEVLFLINIQKNLYLIMAYLSGAKIKLEQLSQETKKFEQLIDKYTSQLPKLNRFILNSGSKTASLFHMLRTTTRLCERRVITHLKNSKKMNNENEKLILIYLNRMSDLFFTYARKYSKNKEI